MSKELVISSNRHETRVAILEDDQVVEVYHQRENEYSLAGSIHKGRVTRVLPGMQSAFVDIGLDRDAFLYVSDFFEDNEEYDKIVTSVEDKVLKLDRVPASAPEPATAPRAEAPAAEAVEPAAPCAAGSPGGSRRGAAEPRTFRTRGSRPTRTAFAPRRRGKGGRGLPDSKFYSARGGADIRPNARRRRRPERRSGAVACSGIRPRPPGDDFFVLPGESLAKYAKPGGNDASERRALDWASGGGGGALRTIDAAEQHAAEREDTAAEAEAASEPDQSEARQPLSRRPNRAVRDAGRMARSLGRAATGTGGRRASRRKKRSGGAAEACGSGGNRCRGRAGGGSRNSRRRGSGQPTPRNRPRSRRSRRRAAEEGEGPRRRRAGTLEPALPRRAAGCGGRGPGRPDSHQPHRHVARAGPALSASRFAPHAAPRRARGQRTRREAAGRTPRGAGSAWPEARRVAPEQRAAPRSAARCAGGSAEASGLRSATC